MSNGLDTTTWLQWAQFYAGLGLPVLPLEGKEPARHPSGRLTPEGKPVRLGAYAASSDPAQWRAWMAHYGSANIGIAIPQGKLAIDVDPRHAGDVDFEALEREHGERFDFGTFTQRSGGGGLHLIYDVPADTRYPLGKLEGKHGIDIKQHGGYLVAAPSVHPDTGKRYEIAGAMAFASPPSWVRARLTSSSESRVARDASHDRRLDDMRFGMDPTRAIADVPDAAIVDALRAVAPLYVPGNRHHVRVKMGALLNRLGWSRESIERFGRGLYAAYGGDNEDKIARETVMGMAYPSGYFDLVAMAPAGYREAIGKALDGIHNPFGSELRATNARARQQIEAAFAQQQQTQPAETATRDDRVARGRALRDAWRLTAPREPIKPLILGIPVADGITTFIVGAPNAGKTPFALLLATSLATGRPLLGRATTQRPVVLLAFEKSHEGSPKLWRVACGVGVDVAKTDGLTFVEADRQGLHLGDATTRDEVAALVAAIHADTGMAPVVIVDTYSSSVNGLKPNDGEYAAPMREFDNALRAIAPCAIVHLVHTRKDIDGRISLADIGGTGQLAAVCSAAVALDRVDPEDKTRLRLSVLRGETSDSCDLEFRWSDPSGDAGPLVATVIASANGEIGESSTGTSLSTRPAKRETRDDRNDAAQVQLERVLDSMQDGESLTLTELRQRGGVSKTARYTDPFDARVKVAVKDGRLSTTPNGRGSYRYRRQRQVCEMPAPNAGGFPVTHVQPPGVPPLLPLGPNFDPLPGTPSTATPTQPQRGPAP